MKRCAAMLKAHSMVLALATSAGILALIVTLAVTARANTGAIDSLLGTWRESCTSPLRATYKLMNGKPIVSTFFGGQMMWQAAIDHAARLPNDQIDISATYTYINDQIETPITVGTSAHTIMQMIGTDSSQIIFSQLTTSRGTRIIVADGKRADSDRAMPIEQRCSN